MYRRDSSTLPIPPRDILERFYVQDPLDTRFQACSRLLQSIWRDRKGLPIGGYELRDGSIRALGSRLGSPAGRAGRSYLRPEIAKLVRREIAYRERGALIDEARTWENLLSSTTLVFNLFGPMKLNAALAKRVLRKAFGVQARRVNGVFFETSPGRGDHSFIADKTALDVLIAYTDSNDESGFLGIEVKYAEGRPGSATMVSQRHLDVARRSKLFRDPCDDALKRPPFRQFFAEHSLCYAMVHEQPLFSRGTFVIVYPTLNAEMDFVVEEYQKHLLPGMASALPLKTVCLADIVAAVGEAGDADLAQQLNERYLDFGPVSDLIDDWEPDFTQ